MPEPIRWDKKPSDRGSVRLNGERRIGDRPPFHLHYSSRGLGFSCLAIGLLALGALRAEPGALISGAGLGAAILLSLAGVLFEGRRSRRMLYSDSEALGICVSPPLRNAEGIIRGSISISNRTLPPPRALGVATVVVLELRARNGRTMESLVVLPSKNSTASSPLPLRGWSPRGLYRGRAILESGDMFGFFETRIPVASDLEAVVLPDPSMPFEVYLEGEGGDSPALSNRRAPGEERFDARPYVPGDDTRLIHWKQYARFGDLFVRTADLQAPPYSAVHILVDTERPPFLEGAAGEAYLDRMVSIAAGLAGFLRDRGRRVLCSTQGSGPASEDATDLEVWFSDLAWRDGAIGAFAARPEPLIIVGAPGGTGRGAFLGKGGDISHRTTLLIPDLPKSGRDSRVERFFLTPRPEDSMNPSQASRTAFSEALKRDLFELSGAGGVDVRVL